MNRLLSRAAEIELRLRLWNEARAAEAIAVNKAAAAAEAYVDQKISDSELCDFVKKLKAARTAAENAFRAYSDTYNRKP